MNESPIARPFSCLIVDDDAGFASILTRVVREEGGSVEHRGTIQSAREEIERRSYDLVVLDNRLPDGTGFEFHAQLIQRSPGSIVVMVTGMPELSQAVELTRNGLFDYLVKPLEADDFRACLRRARQRLGHPESQDEARELIGESPPMRAISHQLSQAARHFTTTVLLLGETGTGKDLVARLLHRMTFAGRNPRPPYVALNCSAVPAEMFEAELFGSEKGAYTGADKRRAGLVESAEGGTLFLDEVTEIPIAQQAKLLRFLESREYRSLGNTAPRQFTGRVVAATNRSLTEEVRRGRFREDLMFRLDVFSIRLPSLREHIADLESLAEFLLTQLCEKYQRKKPFLKAQDMESLRTYAFPGNVRELRNLLERSLLKTPAESPWLAVDLAWMSTAATPATTVPADHSSMSSASARQLTGLELQEYQLIQKALHEEDGGIRRAAAKLGLTHQSLLRRLQKWPELRQVRPPGF